MSLHDFIADVLVDVIIGRRRSNRDRTALDSFELAFLDALSVNRYNNDNFDMVVNSLAQNIEVFEDEVIRSSIDRDPIDAVERYLDLVMVKTIMDEKGLLDSLNDNDYEYVRKIYDSEAYEIMIGGGRRRGGYGGRHNDRGFSDRGFSSRGRSGGYSDDRYDNRGRGRNSGYASRGRDIPERDNTHITKRAVRANDGWSQIARASMDAQQEVHQESQQSDYRDDHHTYDRNYRDDYERAPRTPREPQAAPYPEHHGPEYRTTRHVPTQNIVFKHIPPREQQGYDHTSENPYEEFWEDDRLWQASVKSKWRLTGTGIDAYPVLYNIYKYVSYHVMDMYGNVTQEFKDVDDDNRYINQTLLKDPDSYAKAFSRKAPRMDDLKDTRELDMEHEEHDTSQDVDLDDMLDICQSDLENISHIVNSDNLSTSVIEGRSSIEDGKNSSLNMFMLINPIEGVNRTEADLIRGLYNQNTLLGLSKELLAIEDRISRYNWQRINKDLSTKLVDIMCNVFGIDIKAMNFAKNWPDLLKHLSNQPSKYSREWIDNFSRKMNGLIPKLIGVMDPLDANGEIAPYFEHVINKDNVNTVVPFVDFYAVVSLRCTLDQMAIGRQLELNSPLVIRAGNDVYSSGILHSLLNELNNSKTNTATLLLSTRCGALVEVRPHELNSPNLVLSLFQY